MSEEKKDANKEEKIVNKLNNAFVDFVGKVFGDSGKNFVKDTQKKVKEFSSSSIKKFMEFSDSVLEKAKLKDNESVKKTRDTIEDMLKQLGLIEENEQEF